MMSALRTRSRSLAPEALVVAGGAVFALLGRGRWADVIIDCGLWYSDLERVLRGGRILHEVRIHYGPLSPWLLAAGCRAFGASVATVVAFQFVLGMAAAVAVLVQSRRFLGSGERFFAAAWLTVLIVWMPGTGNLLYPYAFAVSPGLVLAAAALILGAGAAEKSSTIRALAAGAAAGLAWNVKQELGGVALIGIAITILAHRSDGLSRIRLGLCACLAAAASWWSVLWLFARGEPFSVVAGKNNLWPFVAMPVALQSNWKRVQGLAALRRTLLHGGSTFLFALGAAGAAWVLARGLRFEARRAVLLLACALGLGAAAVVLWWAGGHVYLLTLCLPALLAAAAIGWPDSPRWSRLPGGRASLLAAAAGALLLLWRVGFQGNDAGAYAGMGYVMCVPVGVFLAGEALDRLKRNYPRGRIVAAACAGAAAAAILGYGARRIRTLEAEWARKTPIASPRGTVWVDPLWRDCLSESRDFLAATSAPGERVLLVPETKALDFLLDRPNDSFHSSLGPGMPPEVRAELLSLWEREPPRAVVVFERTNLAIYGRGEFGQGDDSDLMAWITAHDVLVRRVAPAGGVPCRLYRAPL